MEEEGQEIAMAGGAVSSSKIPGFHYIPTEALIRLAERFEEGIRRKRDKAWNALSKNQEVLINKEFILERIGHVIGHALKLRDKIQRGATDFGDDDAGAISWSGAFLCCATKALSETRLNCSACGGIGRMVVCGGADLDKVDTSCPACKGTGKERPKP